MESPEIHDVSRKLQVSTKKWTFKAAIWAFLLVTMGSLSTLLAKFANKQEYSHPFVQTAGQFGVEFLMLVLFYIIALIEKYAFGVSEKCLPWTKSGLLALPAFCEVLSTCMLYIALSMTSASSYQMLRGSVIIFTALISRMFFKRKLVKFQWFSLIVILLGLVIVGLSDFNSDKTPTCMTTFKDASARLVTYHPPEKCVDHSIMGDMMVLGAMVVYAVQQTYEEKVLKGYNISPLNAIGWEGFYGFSIISLMVVASAYIPTNSLLGHSPSPPYYLEDPIGALKTLIESPTLFITFLGVSASVPISNYFGMSLTKEMTATTRMILETLRTFVVWVVSLGLEWQKFYYLQPLGFVVMIIGFFLYYDILILPCARRCNNITRDRITERQQKHAVFDNKNIDEEANRRDVG